MSASSSIGTRSSRGNPSEPHAPGDVAPVTGDHHPGDASREPLSGARRQEASVERRRASMMLNGCGDVRGSNCSPSSSTRNPSTDSSSPSARPSGRGLDRVASQQVVDAARDGEQRAQVRDLGALEQRDREPRSSRVGVKAAPTAPAPRRPRVTSHSSTAPGSPPESCRSGAASPRGSDRPKGARRKLEGAEVSRSARAKVGRPATPPSTRSTSSPKRLAAASDGLQSRGAAIHRSSWSRARWDLTGRSG